MEFVDGKAFHSRLYEAGTQLEHASDTNTGILKALEKVEFCLSMVEQALPSSMSRSLRHGLRLSMNRLVEEHLLRHQDRDVRLLVLSCLGQIAKITAPYEPYDDEVMKEILELIVESFQDLGEMNSSSFARRFSLLKIVEKIKLSTVMLNLGMDDLLCEMCKHFFAAVSQHAYSADVCASMKKIMRFVLEESDEISQELLSVFLINLRRERRNSSPAAHSLAMDVVTSCAETLRPYLKEKFPPEKAIHINCVHRYNEIVHDICRHGSQETNSSEYTTSSDREASVTDTSIPEPTESDSQITSSPMSPDGPHNESEVDVRLVSLFSQKPPNPFPDVTSGCKRRRAKKRSEVKEDDSVWEARVETGSEGISSPEDTVGESANNVSVSRSLKRRRLARNSAKKMRSLKEIETSEDSWMDED